MFFRVHTRISRMQLHKRPVNVSGVFVCKTCPTAEKRLDCGCLGVRWVVCCALCVLLRVCLPNWLLLSSNCSVQVAANVVAQQQNGNRRHWRRHGRHSFACNSWTKTALIQFQLQFQLQLHCPSGAY